MSGTHLMTELTVREVAGYARRWRAVLVPLGACEQHGYHLPLSTDSHNAREFCRRAADRTGALVAPVLHYGFSGGTLPGTVDISPATVAQLVADILESLARQGFRRIVLVAGHGGSENEAALRAGADRFLRARLPDTGVAVALFRFWESSETARALFAAGDYHAGCLETSLMMYWQPELVGKAVRDEPAVTGLLEKDQDAWQVKKKPVDDQRVLPAIAQHPGIKVGVMGFPEKADRALGEKICREVVDDLVGLVERLQAS